MQASVSCSPQSLNLKIFPLRLFKTITFVYFVFVNSWKLRHNLQIRVKSPLNDHFNIKIMEIGLGVEAGQRSKRKGMFKTPIILNAAQPQLLCLTKFVNFGTKSFTWRSTYKFLILFTLVKRLLCCLLVWVQLAWMVKGSQVS